MKQGISPAMAVVIVLIVVVVIGAIGYFAFLRPKAKKQEASSQSMEDHMQQAEGMKRQAQQEAQAEAGGPPRGPGSPEEGSGMR